MTLRLLSYNIRHGGAGREQALVDVVRQCTPDVVVLQEATRPEVVARMARDAGFPAWGARPGSSLGFLSRAPIASADWQRPPVSRHAFLELVLGGGLRIFGVHLAAVHAAWTERRRTFEFRALLASIRKRQHGFHLLAGDFNTLAPGELLDPRRLPARLRLFVWLSGGRVRYRTIDLALAAGYTDAFRYLNGSDPGATFPSWDPHVRLDFVFVPEGFADRVRSCAVVVGPGMSAASDHLPLLAEVDDG
ncbi:MAG TPA: endonuclease/exonuclease/phosphatase family protein [Vicinamibacterales bacterium]|nr:endonuclease/exonuclease/phosphatase family protein [Vicinamibacterales bacterium]